MHLPIDFRESKTSVHLGSQKSQLGSQENTIGIHRDFGSQSHPTSLAANDANESSDCDLFGVIAEASESHYPESPGFKGGASSREAAAKIAIFAGTVRAEVLLEYAAAGDRGLTADQCAKAINRSILTVRPRVSELVRAGYLVPVDERRRNDSGMSAAVLRVTDAGLRALPKGGVR